MRVVVAAGLALALVAGAGRAQDLNMTVIDCQTHNAAQEQADMDLAETALGAMGKANASGSDADLAALKAMLPDLETALSHAPDKPSLPEHCGDSIILYSGDMMQMLVLSAAIGKDKSLGATHVEQREPLPYALLAFAVGWIRFEGGDYAGADAADRKGLLNDPNDATLMSEDSFALSKLGRNAEALTALDAFIAGHPALGDDQMALLQRKRGYVLVELDRLDDAEAAYKKSLDLDPGNATALSELDYIHSLTPSH